MLPRFTTKYTAHITIRSMRGMVTFIVIVTTVMATSPSVCFHFNQSPVVVARFASAQTLVLVARVTSLFHDCFNGVHCFVSVALAATLRHHL